MDQTYGFFGFIIYLLSFLGCGGGSYDNTTSDSYYQPEETIKEAKKIAQYEVDYYRSLEEWNQEKKKHNNSYEYTLFFENSMSTYRRSTIVVVKDGAVYSRAQKAYLRNTQTDKMEPLKKETWKESQKQLGTQDDAPKTLEELYEDCSTILIVDSESNEIVFTMDNYQIMSACGYRNFDCADDCFRGVRLQNFKWLD